MRGKNEYQGGFRAYFLIIGEFSLLFLLFILICVNKTFACNTNEVTTPQNKLILANDSGFITKEFGLNFLLNDSLILYANELETTPDELFWQDYNLTDTIGKYYNKENSDHYIMCLIDFFGEKSFEDYIIIEINAKGELLKSEKFSPKRYRCWTDAYDGFSKYNDFFGIKVCIGGPGWSYTDLYLFKEIMPQDSINPVPVSGWLDHAAEGLDFLRTFEVSSMEIKKNEVIIHYLKDKEKYKYDKKGKFLYGETVEKDKKITVEYIYNNGKWEVKNKSEWKKLDCY